MNPIRPLLLRASTSRWLSEHVPRWRFVRRAARRFIPGEHLDDALCTVEELAAGGSTTLLTRLGENVTTAAEAEEVRDHYLDVLARLDERHPDAHLSVKPTQFGLDVDPALCRRLLTEVALAAGAKGSMLWLDMESSEYVEATLDLVADLQSEDARIGVCLQSYLLRTADDLERLLDSPAAVRMVKGAYREPATIAFSHKRDTDESFFELGVRMLEAAAAGGARHAFGTHDARLIERLCAVATERGIDRDAFEVQMLYGIGTELQRSLLTDGYRVRILVSYGDAWYAWYLRRLAERPANILFVLKNLFRK